MFELVRTPESLVKNVKEYQKAIKEGYDISPSLVRHWYYIPALDMVGASKFIGYDGMTPVLYVQMRNTLGGLHGGKTQQHLKDKGWFRQIEKREPRYAHAYQLAQSLDKKGRVYKDARFNVLKDIYDKQIRK